MCAARGRTGSSTTRHCGPTLFQALGTRPVELNAGTDDEYVVPVDSSVGTGHCPVLRVDGRCGVLDPRRLFGHHRRLRASRGRGLCLAAADECPQRLVIVRLRRLDDCDIRIISAEQARGNGDPRGATADDQNLMHVRNHDFCSLSGFLDCLIPGFVAAEDVAHVGESALPTGLRRPMTGSRLRSTRRWALSGRARRSAGQLCHRDVDGAGNGAGLDLAWIANIDDLQPRHHRLARRMPWRSTAMRPRRRPDARTSS